MSTPTNEISTQTPNASHPLHGLFRGWTKQDAIDDIFISINNEDDPLVVQCMMNYFRLDTNIKYQGDPNSFILYDAVVFQRHRVLKYLLSLPDLNVNCVDLQDCGGYFDSATPLMAACARDDDVAVKLLLERKDLEVNTVSIWGKFALLFCKDGPCLDLLLADPRTDVNQFTLPTDEWRGGGDEDARNRLAEALSEREVGVVNKLLAHPRINLNAQNPDGETVLFWISEGPLTEKILMDDRSNLTLCNTDGDNVRQWHAEAMGWNVELFDKHYNERLQKSEEQVAALVHATQEQVAWPEGLMEIYVQPFLFVKLTD